MHQLKNWPTCNPTHTGQFGRGAHTPPLYHTHKHESESLLCSVALSCRFGYDAQTAAVPIKQCQMQTSIQNMTSTRHMRWKYPQNLPLFEIQQHRLDNPAGKKQ